MRLLFISEYFPTTDRLDYKGGVEARLTQLISRLSQSNDIFVITTRLKNVDKETLYGATVLRCGPRIKYNLNPNLKSRILFMIEAIKIGRRLDVELIEGTDFVTHFIAWVVGKFKKTPVIAWYPDVFVGSWIKNMGFVSGLMGWTLEKFNLSRNWGGVIAISNTTKGKLLREGVKRNRVVVIPCGVDLDRLPKKLKSTEKFSLICVSRLVSYKKIDLLIEAIRAIDNKIDSYHLLIIGSGPQENGVKKLIDRYGLGRKIKVVGFVQKHRDVLEKIAESSILVHPSLVEGFGIVLVEAMALHTPYVAFKLPAFEEITHGGKGGILVPIGDVEEFGRAILKFKNNKEFYSRKSLEARKTLREFSWDKIARDTMVYYQKVLYENRNRL